MASFLGLERCLLPAPETIYWDEGELAIEKYTTTQKVTYYVGNLFTFVGLLFVLPLTLSYDWLTQKKIVPISEVLNQTTAPTWPPPQRGFASSLFQASGLGTKWSAPSTLSGRSDWDKWLDDPTHILHPENFDYKDFFTDILSDPSAYIKMLKEQNVTAHRFSLEWSVMEPRQGEFDAAAVALYQNFIEKLLQAEITPFITLSHFVVPNWFYKLGNFQKIENIELYVNFALKALELFPEVKDWWSFNELGIKAFQQTREVYPTDLPKGSPLAERVYAAGIATRNMLIAHCKLHKEIATLYPDKKVGVTHQWLKFDMETGNWLESLFAYFFTKFGFTPVYQFFKEGHYFFEFPFMANIHFKIPKEQFGNNNHFLMRLGVQMYPKPMVKMGLNHGQTYPGLPEVIQNLPFFSFGSTCELGGTVMRFGPRWRAEAIDEFLDEAFALTKEVCITEYGSDAMVQKWGEPRFALNDEAQANYLRQLTDRIRDYSMRTLQPIKAIFCWSDIRRQIEWESGFASKLGVIEPIVDENRKMTSWNTTPGSLYLAEVYRSQEV